MWALFDISLLKQMIGSAEEETHDESVLLFDVEKLYSTIQ